MAFIIHGRKRGIKVILLKRLYVENYKLFSQKELDFSYALLSVFDGPNGYGKTSIFDAIELLVTGKISRVVDCESIDGKTAYQTIFFAQNYKKDVILKAEFEDSENDRSFALGAMVKSSDINGRIANPKNIFDKIDFFYLPTYDISIDSWTDYLKGPDEIEEIRRHEFGHQNIEQFTLFHYIRQEDRLSYFKQSETSRAATIENLLGVAKESEKYKKVQAKRKSVDNIYKQISNEIVTKKNCMIESGGDHDHTTEYEPLIDGEQIWDKETVFFRDSNQDKVLAQYLVEIERIEAYVKYADIHSRYFSYKTFMKNPEKLRRAGIHALILLRKNPVAIDDLDTSFQNLIFLNQQKDKIKLQDYKSLELSKIYKILETPEDKNLATGLDTLSDISKNQDGLQNAINNVIQLRENLHLSNAKISENGICPYCGHDWNNQEELEKQFVSTKAILLQLLTQDGELYAKQLEVVKTQIEESLLVEINNKIAELSKMGILAIYGEFDSKEKFVTAIENARAIFDIADSMLVNKGSDVKDDNEYFEKITDECMHIWNMIPSEYLSANEKYTFSEISKKYSLNDGIISKLNKEQFYKKRQYLQGQFYKSFDKLKAEILELENRQDTIREIQVQLKEYEKAIKKSIEAYKKQIIDEIEIPFFVYSSRLLQSYQGGQGVLMKNDGGSIRFTSPGKEHDILYTMSSGQLSAVLLSFSLALNKIYSGQGIKTVLIDDPIQCMDDINMISFVELLRREFSDCQIILSTHEEDFSNFVRYKFKKYGLDTQAITLKDA